MPSLNQPDRREVLRLIAAGAAAALASCSKPDHPIYPRAVDDQAEVGQVRRYATALPLAGYARGVTGLVVEGRPIKLEGLAAHPASLGATDLFTEAAILDLYDPQRLRAPVGPEGVADWSLLQRVLLDRLSGSDGRDLRLLSGRITSPTLLARIAEMKRRFPAMQHHRSEPIGDDAERLGAIQAFGRPLTMRPRLADADVVVTLGADPLGPGPEQVALARGWSRRRTDPKGPQRLHAFEPSPTQTGVCADRRTPATPDQIADLALVIAHALGADSAAGPLPPPISAAASAAIGDLRRATGRAVVLVGAGQPAAVHALAAWINQRLRAPVDWIEPIDPATDAHGISLARLAGDMHAGRVGTLIMLDSDPLYHAPAALGFAEALKRVPMVIAATAFANATSTAARWTVPLSHPLEAWGDLRAPDGTASIAQPLIRPLYGTRSATELLDLVDPLPSPVSAHDRLRAQWLPHADGDPERWWRDLLVAGMVAESAAPPVAASAATLRAYPPAAAAKGIVLTLAPSPTLWDGRLATNAWAQECPDPVTKEVWGSGIRLNAADASAAGISDGDLIALGAAGAAPARIIAGQAPGAATLMLGYGRHAAGHIADVPGANGFAIRASDAGLAQRGGTLDRLTATDKRADITTTQGQFTLDGDLERLFPIVRPGERLPAPPPQATLLPRRPPDGQAPPQWGMVIDTAVCIGCNACVVACQAENNIPAIGPEEMARGRDLHWLRVDRYAHDGGEGFQPVPCMQCETAPCEPVCPVEASVHDSQGLNLQVYNRCVGTRTCQANCPYKVRRFNFLDYAGANLWGQDDHASIEAQRNPEVTVRARGVMEKCTYCVQRIETARADADANGRPLDTGAVRTACQSACPTEAIHFGDLTQSDSEVSQLRGSPRHYGLLEELGTRPRTTYLAQLRDEGTT